ncbi:MAG: hypothetical protein E7575_03335 [Ruminococcaceae bacterium]|nr:hypothetical protein [Oscillospiraceae bacterium]
MNYIPKQKNKAADVTILALFLCATVAVGFSAIEMIPGKGILQSVGLFIFVAMIYVLVRYKFTTFEYQIRIAAKPKKSLHNEDSEEETVKEGGEVKGLPITAMPPEALELCINRKQGRRNEYFECIVRLSEIESCQRLPNDKKEKKEALKKIGKMPTYKYLVNMVGADQLLLTAKVLGKRVIIIIEAEGKFADYLCAVARFNNEK